MKKKIVVFLATFIIAFAVTYYFIKKSNDHKECTDVVKTVHDKDGNVVTVTKHNCTEKYNF